MTNGMADCLHGQVTLSINEALAHMMLSGANSRLESSNPRSKMAEQIERREPAFRGH